MPLWQDVLNGKLVPCLICPECEAVRDEDDKHTRCPECGCRGTAVDGYRRVRVAVPACTP